MVVSVGKAARVLGISASTMRKWDNEEKLKASIPQLTKTLVKETKGKGVMWRFVTAIRRKNRFINEE